MIKPKQTIPVPKPSLIRPLALLRQAILQTNPGDKSLREEVVEAIDAALQTESPDSLKIQESALSQGIEVLKGLFESAKDKSLFEELYILGKLLEKCYIHSTDIEYAQFYNKELAIRCDNIVNERRLQDGLELDRKKLNPDIEKIFLEIENKKQDYFEENYKEMSERTEHRKNKETALNNYLQEVR